MRDRLHFHGLFRSIGDVAPPRWVVLTIIFGTLLAGLLTSCYGYVWDVFPEMHYQQSYRQQEPPRRLPPADSVPVTGKAREYSFAEAVEIANPLSSTPARIESGEQLFMTNCKHCHGADGRGEGPVGLYFDPLPQAMQGDRITNERTDGEIYWILTNSLGNMPSFGNLLTPEERWELILFIRSLQESDAG
ncbi:MAG: cytochrome c [Chloroflexi bacterium]|nr:cytochrome c [Chloroflexota bacterium]